MSCLLIHFSLLLFSNPPSILRSAALSLMWIMTMTVSRLVLIRCPYWESSKWAKIYCYKLHHLSLSSLVSLCSFFNQCLIILLPFALLRLLLFLRLPFLSLKWIHLSLPLRHRCSIYNQLQWSKRTRHLYWGSIHLCTSMFFCHSHNVFVQILLCHL